MNLPRRRGYIRADERLQGALERWELPSYVQSDAKPRETAINFDPAWEPDLHQEQVQSDEPELDLTMLTADALENIRQSAVDEGMAEGKELGFNQGKESGFEQGKLEGIEEGKKEGFAQGLSDGQDDINAKCQHLDEIIEKLAFPILQIDNQVQQQMMGLVLQLVKAVIQTEVQTNPKVILNTVHETVKALPMADRQITLYLHPEDLEIVQSAHSESSLKERKWRLIGEPSLERGDIQAACCDSLVDFKMEDRILQLLAKFSGQNSIKEPVSDNGLGENVLIEADQHQDILPEKALDTVEQDEVEIKQELTSQENNSIDNLTSTEQTTETILEPQSQNIDDSEQAEDNNEPL